MRFAILFAVATSVLSLAACGGSPVTSYPTVATTPRNLTVFAASSLTAAFTEVASAFETATPRVKVTFSFQATSTLRTQLEQGATADVLASADQPQMDLARKAGLLQGEPLVFATNRLAVVTRADSTKVAGLRDLAKDGVKVILVAPQTPIGTYTADVLRKLEGDPAYGPDFVKRLRSNVVSEALNVSQAAATVQLGEADAAIIYVTDARATGGAPLAAVPIPEQYADKALYPIAVLKSASAADLAQRFINFLRSNDGASIMGRHGFGRP